MAASSANDGYRLGCEATEAEYEKKIAVLRADIAQRDEELNDEQIAHQQIADLCIKAGASDTDGTSISLVKNLIAARDEEVSKLVALVAKWRALAALWECDGEYTVLQKPVSEIAAANARRCAEELEAALAPSLPPTAQAGKEKP